MEEFHKTYENKEVMEEYKNLLDLQKPELVIFEKYKNIIEGSDFLDIGIGTGRTTIHLSPLVNSYTGIDISNVMIDEAKKKFTDNKNHLHVADARKMHLFKDNSFDVVLFSFNGIDYVSNEDRNQIFEEIVRVAKNNALFIFSSHNIFNIPILFSLKFSLHPYMGLMNVLKYIKLKRLNYKTSIRNKEMVRINDGAHNFQLITTYIKPSFQLKQLKQFNLKELKAFSYYTGSELEEAKIDICSDPWIYYTCFVTK